MQRFKFSTILTLLNYLVNFFQKILRINFNFCLKICKLMMITMQVTFSLRILITFAQRTQSIISGWESYLSSFKNKNINTSHSKYI